MFLKNIFENLKIFSLRNAKKAVFKTKKRTKRSCDVENGI